MFCNFEKVFRPTLPDILATVKVLQNAYSRSLIEHSCMSCRFGMTKTVTEMGCYTTEYNFCNFYNEFKTEVHCSRWQQEDENKHYKILYDYIVNMGKVRYGANNESSNNN